MNNELPQVKFSHDYEKLMRIIFPTVRSVNYNKEKKFDVGDFVEVHSPSMKFIAKLINYEDWKICDMELGFIKYDCYPIECESHEDYINLLNSFIPKFDPNKLNTIKRIYWFQKVR